MLGSGILQVNRWPPGSPSSQWRHGGMEQAYPAHDGRGQEPRQPPRTLCLRAPCPLAQGPFTCTQVKLRAPGHPEAPLQSLPPSPVCSSASRGSV